MKTKSKFPQCPPSLLLYSLTPTFPAIRLAYNIFRNQKKTGRWYCFLNVWMLILSRPIWWWLQLNALAATILFTQAHLIFCANMKNCENSRSFSTFNTSQTLLCNLIGSSLSSNWGLKRFLNLHFLKNGHIVLLFQTLKTLDGAAVCHSHSQGEDIFLL